MRKILIFVFCLIFKLNASAQIMLSPVVDSAIEGLNENNVTIVENRLRSIISSLGMESGWGTRFVLACKVAALQREVSGTKLIQHLEVTFAIGDNVGNTCFGSTAVECLGIGNTEQQAMTNALKNIKNTAELKKLVATSKERIIDYYTQNAAAIIKKAQGLMAAQQWEEALYELTAIPQEVPQYPQALDMMQKVYTTHINHDAAQVLNEAKALWSADPNPGPTAEQAMAILATINTSASCYPQAQALMRKIEARVKNVTDADRAHEKDMEKRRLNATVSLQKARIQACRDVAVAYAKRKVVVVRHYHRWW